MIYLTFKKCNLLSLIGKETYSFTQATSPRWETQVHRYCGMDSFYMNFDLAWKRNDTTLFLTVSTKREDYIKKVSTKYLYSALYIYIYVYRQFMLLWYIWLVMLRSCYIICYLITVTIVCQGHRTEATHNRLEIIKFRDS